MLESLIDTANTMILLLDDEKNITLFNQYAQDLTGYLNEEIIGRNIVDMLVPTEQRNQTIHKLETILNRDQTELDFEGLVKIRTGEYKHIIWRSSLLERDDEYYVLLIGTDISRLKQTEIDLKYRLAIEKNIAEISKKLIYNQGGIEDTIGELGRLTALSRIFVVKYESETSIFKNVYNWCSYGHRQIFNKVSLEDEQLNWFLDYIKDGKDIIINDIDKMPDTAAASRDFLKKHSCKAVLAVPIISSTAELLGFIVLDDMENTRQWMGDDLKALHIIADMLANYWMNEDSKHKLKQSYLRLEEILDSTVSTLASMVESRDPYTASHQFRVAELAVAIAKKMGISGKQLKTIRIAGLLHDIGKIKVPSEILNKPGVITKAEFSIIREHPETSYYILKRIDFDQPVAPIVLQHHERIDGSGYPAGLKGDEILLEAKILAVADVVEAMSSHRPYRAALGIEKALEEIKSGRGIRYEPAVVDALLLLEEYFHD